MCTLVVLCVCLLIWALINKLAFSIIFTPFYLSISCPRIVDAILDAFHFDLSMLNETDIQKG